MLAVLRAAGGRVVSRRDLAAAAGLGGLSERRVDGVLVRLRRALPPGTLVTGRGCGWALLPPDVHAMATPSKQPCRPPGTRSS